MVETRDEQGKGAATTVRESGDGASQQTFRPGEASSPDEPWLPRGTRALGPLVDRVAGINASVHAKLLVGFLALALLLLGMGILNSLVIERMSQRVGEITRLQEKVDRSRQMEYLVTAQSHFRAMALLTND